MQFNQLVELAQQELVVPQLVVAEQAITALAAGAEATIALVAASLAATWATA